MSDFRNKNLGLYQFHHLYRVYSYRKCNASSINRWSKKDEAMDKAKILENLNLSHRFTHRPQELSGYEQQREAIARALINNPKVLLIFTGNLDSKNAQEVIIYSRNWDEQTHTILVTHQSLQNIR